MSEFKVKGEIFNLQNMENNVVPIRDILETRKSLIRSSILAIISDSSNANYIEDADLQAAIMNPDVLFENIFTVYKVQSNYQLTSETIPAIVEDTSSTITIQSTVTLSIPMNPADINYNNVVTKTTNTIENTDYNTLTNVEKTVIEESYRNAYIKQIASSVNGITETDLQNSTINVILSNDGNGGVNVDFKITDIPSSSEILLENVQNAIVNINNSPDLSSAVKQEMTILAPQYGITLGIDLNDIPTTSDIFIALSRINTSGIETEIPDLDHLLSKSLDDMSDTEKYVVKEAYATTYINEAAKKGVVLSRNNVVIYLVSGSIKVIIKVINIETSNQSFAQSVENFFELTSSESTPITSQMISTASMTALNDILTGNDVNAPPNIISDVQAPGSTLYTELNTFFQSNDFVNAVESSTSETVTLEISADGQVSSFVIVDMSGVGKGIKKLPNKDAGMFTDERKRDAIKKGKLNNSVGGVEKESIVFQVNRRALRRARNTNYRVNSKYTKCC